MAKLPEFIIHMDKRAVRAVATVLGMFVLVAVVIVFARNHFDLTENDVKSWFEAVGNSPWSLPLTIIIFVLGAFIGIPQWALIAGAIVAFGPVYGGLYAWLSTMISASVDFWLGRWIGAKRLATYAGPLVNRITNVIRNNGVVTSFAVRFVPTGPFALVNMAAGVSGMTFAAFVIGTAAGIIPKILVVVLIAVGVVTGAQGQAYVFTCVILAIAFMIVMLLARRRLGQYLGQNDR